MTGDSGALTGSFLSSSDLKLVEFQSPVSYETALKEMKSRLEARLSLKAQGRLSPDEFWLLEHLPVYTLGLRGRKGATLPTEIPVIQSDRGGDITYHGPGQWVVYLLLDLLRLGISPFELTSRLERALFSTLEHFSLKPVCFTGNPGVYLPDPDRNPPYRKIASLGLRVRRGFSYHGLALNVKMDLSPFDAIDPCGIPRLKMTDLNTELSGLVPLPELKAVLLEALQQSLYAQVLLSYPHGVLRV